MAQAIAGKLMLNLRGIASTMYLGVMKRDEMKAHAWLRVGQRIITGRRGHQNYTVIARIGNRSERG